MRLTSTDTNRYIQDVRVHAPGIWSQCAHVSLQSPVKCTSAANHFAYEQQQLSIIHACSVCLTVP